MTQRTRSQESSNLPDDRRPASGAGRKADTPAEIPKRGWWEIAKRSVTQVGDDHVQILAAGVAFYFFFSLFPAIAAAISLYGLVAEPAQAQQQVDGLAGMLPQETAKMISGIAEDVSGQADQSLGWGMAFSLLLSLWSANKGTKALFEGLNIAYDEEDGRNFVMKNAITLLVTFVGMITIVVLMALVAGWSAVGGALGLPDAVATVVSWLRWPVMAAIVMAFLAWIYKLAPDRDRPEWRWVSAGSVVATILWLTGSWFFSLYVDHFGKFGETYGSFAAVIILMLWFYLTAFIVLLGAEINSETEHQTAKDTTIGPDEPMGQRGAVHADHVASETGGKDSAAESRRTARG